jgi:diacylglycerol kinase family enzyme
VRKIGIILNEKAGASDPYDELKKLSDSLSPEEYEVDIKFCTETEEIRNETINFLKNDFDTIVAAGGDGTVNTVSEYLIKSDILFGILPVGTLNHLAKDLRLPLNTTDAFNLIIEKPNIMVMDIGVCNDHIFLNNSGLGIYPRIVELREKFRKGGHVKNRALLMAILQVIRKIPKIFVNMKIGEETIQKKTSFIFVGNNIYGLGGFTTGTRTSLTDGKLSIWISHRTSFFGLMGLLFRAFFGNVKEHRDFDVFEAESICVETKRKDPYVSFDGEIVRVSSPLKYKIEPNALKVIVPLPATEEIVTAQNFETK